MALENPISPVALRVLEENYPADVAEVERLKALVEKTKEDKAYGKYYDPISSLMARVADCAEREGIEHVPAILQVIRGLEEGVPEESRKLTMRKYLEFLATGEITSAQKSANSLKKFEGAREHLENSQTLLDLIERL